MRCGVFAAENAVFSGATARNARSTGVAAMIAQDAKAVARVVSGSARRTGAPSSRDPLSASCAVGANGAGKTTSGRRTRALTQARCASVNISRSTRSTTTRMTLTGGIAESTDNQWRTGVATYTGEQARCADQQIIGGMLAGKTVNLMVLGEYGDLMGNIASPANCSAAPSQTILIVSRDRDADRVAVRRYRRSDMPAACIVAQRLARTVGQLQRPSERGRPDRAARQPPRQLGQLNGLRALRLLPQRIEAPPGDRGPRAQARHSPSVVVASATKAQRDCATLAGIARAWAASKIERAMGSFSSRIAGLRSERWCVLESEMTRRWDRRSR